MTKAEQAKQFTAEMKSALAELRRVPNLQDWKIGIHVGEREYRFTYKGKSKTQSRREFSVIKKWFAATDAIPQGCKPVRVDQ